MDERSATERSQQTTSDGRLFPRRVMLARVAGAGRQLVHAAAVLVAVGTLYLGVCCPELCPGAEAASAGAIAPDTDGRWPFARRRAEGKCTQQNPTCPNALYTQKCSCCGTLLRDGACHCNCGYATDSNCMDRRSPAECYDPAAPTSGSHGTCDPTQQAACTCDFCYVDQASGTCTVDVLSKDCSGHGTCVGSKKGGDGSCKCDTDWHGPACDAVGPPTAAPSSPTQSPTKEPTPFPTPAPTKAPTKAPTHRTKSPTKAPTKAPTHPTKSPTQEPTWLPTLKPSTTSAAGLSAGAEVAIAIAATSAIFAAGIYFYRRHRRRKKSAAYLKMHGAAHGSWHSYGSIGRDGRGGSGDGSGGGGSGGEGLGDVEASPVLRSTSPTVHSRGGSGPLPPRPSHPSRIGGNLSLGASAFTAINSPEGTMSVASSAAAERIRQLEAQLERQSEHLEVRDAELERLDQVIKSNELKLKESKQEISTLQETWRIAVHDLELHEYVASGSEGRVYRGKWRRTIDVAIKMIPRDPARPQAHGFSNAARRSSARTSR